MPRDTWPFRFRAAPVPSRSQPSSLRARPTAQAAVRGTNAAVVGILGAALYHPVWTSAILGPPDFALALLSFVLLTVRKAPVWIVVSLLAAGGAGLSLL